MFKHTLQVRFVSFIIVMAAIVASFAITVALRPGNQASAVTVDSACGICIQDGGVVGGVGGAPASLHVADGGVV